MKIKTHLLVLLMFFPSSYLFSKPHLYVAPLCIGISFAGAFSWSVFRRPTREKITHTSINPVFLTPTPKKSSNPYTSLEKIIDSHKKKKPLNHRLPLSNTHDLIASRKATPSTIEPLWLVVPGYKGKRPKKYQGGTISLDSSLHEASTLMRAAKIPSSCVTFDFDDRRRSFNFAQKGDLSRLSLLYNEVAAENSIVLFGSCRGGTTVLNLLSRAETPYKDSIKALILESPALSLKKLAEQVGHQYVGWLPGSPTLIHTFFRGYFPSYDAHYPSCLSNLENIPHDLPILIGHVENDKVIAWSDIKDLVSGLSKSGHKNVYLARINDPKISHARLNSNEQFKNVLNAFLAKYHLPHDQAMAAAGIKLLEKAQQETLRIAHICQ